MEESETLALKKAYAEIILNTAKESAARIIASQKKAQRFQQDLIATKEESTRLCLRLKHILDAKSVEAEVTSSNQQIRIDELEAQLHEAEDIITDLRTELRWVRDNLEKVKKCGSQPLNIKNNVTEDLIFRQTAIHEATRDTRSTVTNHVPLDNNSCGATKLTDPSSLSHPLKKNETVTETTANFDDKCTSQSLKVKSMVRRNNSIGEGTRKFIKACPSRRRKTRYGRAKAISRGSYAAPYIRSCQLSSVSSHRKVNKIDDNAKTEKVNEVNSLHRLEEHLQRRSSFYSGNIAIIRKGKRNRKVKTLDSLTSGLIPSDQPTGPCQPNLGAVNKLSGEDQLKVAGNDSKVKPMSRLDSGVTLIKRNVDAISGSTNVTVRMKVFNGLENVQSGLEKDGEKRDDIVLVQHKSDAVQSSVVAYPETKPEIVKYSTLDGTKESEETNRSHVKTDSNGDDKQSQETKISPIKKDSNRLIKFTFQRKRKKGSFIEAYENNSPEKCNTKRKKDENQSDVQEPQSSSLVNDSPKDSCGPSQVATEASSTVMCT